MKKVLSVLCIVALLFTFAACSKAPAEEETDAPAEEAADAVETESAE